MPCQLTPGPMIAILIGAVLVLDGLLYIRKAVMTKQEVLDKLSALKDKAAATEAENVSLRQQLSEATAAQDLTDVGSAIDAVDAALTPAP